MSTQPSTYLEPAAMAAPSRTQPSSLGKAVVLWIALNVFQLYMANMGLEAKLPLDRLDETWMLWLSYEISLFALTYTAVTKTFRASTFFWALYCTTFVYLPAIYQAHYQKYPWPPSGDDYSFVAAKFLMLASAIVILCSALQRLPTTTRKRREKRLEINGWHYLFVLAMLLLIYGAVGIKTFFTHRSENMAFGDGGFESQLFVIARFGIIGIFVYFTLALRALGKLGFNPRVPSSAFYWVMIVPTFVAVAMNPATGNRFHFLSSIIILGLLRGDFRIRTLRILIVVLATIACFGSIFELLRDPLGLSGARLAEKDRIYNVDVDVYSTTINIIQYVENQGYNFFSSFLSGILFIVPRSIASFRDLPLPFYAFGFLGFDYVNVSAFLFVEFYAALGWIAVAVGSWALLRINKWADVSSRAFPVNTHVVTTGTAIVYSAFAPILARGSFVGGAGMIGVAFLTLGICGLLGRIKAKSLKKKKND